MSEVTDINKYRELHPPKSLTLEEMTVLRNKRNKAREARDRARENEKVIRSLRLRTDNPRRKK